MIAVWLCTRLTGGGTSVEGLIILTVTSGSISSPGRQPASQPDKNVALLAVTAASPAAAATEASSSQTSP